MSTIQTIEVDAQNVLKLIDTALPLIQAVAPAGGPIGLGVSLAASFLPMLEKIPIGPTFTVEMQQDYLNRCKEAVLLDFSHPGWKLQPETPALPETRVVAPQADKPLGFLAGA